MAARAKTGKLKTWLVIKEGVSQRIGDTDSFEDVPVGALVTFDPTVAADLVAQGFIEEAVKRHEETAE